MITVLYVDDEKDLLDLGKEFLEREGRFKVVGASSAKEGIALLSERKIDVIISDYQMWEMDGIEFLRYVRKNIPNEIPFILFTGRSREEVVIEALNSGATFYVQKGGAAMPQFAELESKIMLAVKTSSLKNIYSSSYGLMLEIMRQGRLDLEPFLSKLINVMSADGAFIAFKHDGVLRVDAALGIKTKRLINMIIPPNRGLGGKVMESKKSLMVNNYLGNRSLFDHDDEVDDAIAAEEIYSGMAAPIYSGSGEEHDEVIGVLYLFSRTERNFTADDLKLISYFGILIAIITQKDKMRMEKNKMMADLMKQKRALTETNKKLTIISGIVRHSIRNYLTVITGLVPLMLLTVLDGQTRRYLLKVQEAADRIVKELDNAKIYQEIGIDSPRWYSSDDILERGSRSKVMLVNKAIGIEIYADPLLKEVFNNLLDNTERHSKVENPIAILRYEHGPEGSLILYYEDNGVGVPSENKKNIFNRGFGDNTGFGLFLAKEILTVTGMEIEEVGEPGKGVRFKVIIPEGSYRIK